MSIHAALIAADPVYASWLADVLGDKATLQWCRPDDPEDPVLAQLARLPDLDLVFVEPNPALIREVADSTQAVIAGVCMNNPGDEAINMIRAGAADLFVLGRDDRTLQERVDVLLRQQLHQQTGEVPVAERQASVISLLGPGGQGDLSFVGTHLALALLQQARPGERVLMIDLSTPAGSALVHLDISQSYSVLDAVVDTYRCDASLIDSAFARHGRDGIYVLSLPEDQIGPVSIAEEELHSLMEVLSNYFRFIVVTACPSLPLPLTRTLMASRRHAAMVTDGSIVHSRATRAFLQALQREDISLAGLGLIADSGRGVRALDSESLARLLELPLWADLNGSNQMREKALNKGQPLFNIAPRDGACKALLQLATQLQTEQDPARAAEPTANGLFARLLSS